MAITAVDTSVVIPALLSWHERHDSAAAAIHRVQKDSLLLPVPVLIESYAVLTRLPAPNRLSPAGAQEVLAKTFANSKVSAFRPRDIWTFLESLTTHGIAGGTTYDAVILEAARSGGAETLLTFNARDFERLDLRSIMIVTPP